ncbi:MAG: hypothetical protein LBM87_01290 [Ruminococcus sp.]|nr:hypothetical protein [Ruminococcus sp.]
MARLSVTRTAFRMCGRPRAGATQKTEAREQRTEARGQKTDFVLNFSI